MLNIFYICVSESHSCVLWSEACICFQGRSIIKFWVSNNFLGSKYLKKSCSYPFKGSHLEGNFWRDFCSEEEKLKKLGNLMDDSHHSCSVLFECRYRSTTHVHKHIHMCVYVYECMYGRIAWVYKVPCHWRFLILYVPCKTVVRSLKNWFKFVKIMGHWELGLLEPDGVDVQLLWLKKTLSHNSFSIWRSFFLPYLSRRNSI